MKTIIFSIFLIIYTDTWGNINQDAMLNHLVDMEQRISYLEEENSKLISTIEEITNKIEEILSSDIIKQQTDTSLMQTAPALESSDTMEAMLYNNSIALISSGDFTLAKNSLLSFIKSYPESIFAAEVHYWIGEINFSDQLYKDAAMHYLSSYKKSPSGNKSIESIFKLALSLKNTNNPIGACHTLKSILTDFGTMPSSLKERVYKELTELKNDNICE
ncbi:hypothetical protein CAXC1_30024 [Candidatus Xenohaliotis californiensis]|uniref:Tol-pal system protein YbgF n=1 Tax=Candidatus Xenohaliotis californiensis TaxID=84677 RepID=A0ABP0EX59_9RICK|nr:hypothetical protein CAXC1_30024 [Candidatus Xenohaliotis californiensis]